MKNKDTQLLEEAYQTILEQNLKYASVLKANPNKIKLKPAAALLSQQSGLNETLVYLDLFKTVDEWDDRSSWDYGIQPIDTFNVKETLRYINDLAAAKSEKDLEGNSGPINFYRAVKLPLKNYRKFAEILQQTPPENIKKYARLVKVFWNEQSGL